MHAPQHTTRPVLGRVVFLVIAVAALLAPALITTAVPSASAHPMPTSVIELNVHSSSISAELQLPVDDLSLASGIDLRGDDADAVLADREDALRTYLVEHLTTETTDGEPWAVDVGDIELTEAEQTSTGLYREIVAQAELTPPAGGDVRHFVFAADPVVHQVVTHSILVSVSSDWAGGQVSEESEPLQIGVIAENSRTMTLAPLTVDLSDGSAWQGFVAMVKLGASHILAGTDHLLFLLVLLLPAPLIAVAGRWKGSIGARKSVVRMAGITAAFTLGHSATLAISALGRFELPTTPIEMFIALSILIGAVHALRPLFPGREALIAGLFGLVHGMAFSFTLAELGLNTGQLVISLLGFNLGIELMQLVVVLLTLPSLILLSRSSWYRPVRILGAGFAAIAATGWVVDRAGYPNPVADLADRVGAYGLWIVVGLAVLAALSFFFSGRRPQPKPDEQQLVGSSH